MAARTENGGMQERVVLIVDDEEPNRQLLSALLSAQGYTVRIACDGPAAIAQVRAGGIDLMLLDVMMPGMDGVEACQRIRKELGLRDLTIVFVTALSDRESRMRAKLAGADDFLVKPIDSFELTFRVANWMKLRTLRDFELCTDELSQRLQETAARVGSLSERLEQLAARDRPLEREHLLHELSAAAAELRQLSDDVRRPLRTRPPSSPSSQPSAPGADFYARNQRT